jgi:hypothetical protein
MRNHLTGCSVGNNLNLGSFRIIVSRWMLIQLETEARSPAMGGRLVHAHLSIARPGESTQRHLGGDRVGPLSPAPAHFARRHGPGMFAYQPQQFLINGIHDNLLK